MAHRQTLLERRAEGRFLYWVALVEEKCTGASYEKIRAFCAQHGLRLSRFGHAVVWQRQWYQVFRFGREEDAETFCSSLSTRSSPSSQRMARTAS
jgi:hypothetical protein